MPVLSLRERKLVQLILTGHPREITERLGTSSFSTGPRTCSHGQPTMNLLGGSRLWLELVRR
ncbi:hypothetical protein MES4922_190280 [Mesorhizobium ventifaucium]|uniref:HTH luxR-type domain-containing protein n=1 Tax=Mesorhizobium ventifaucium TaxID=666020 RepID=A0ABN8JNU1_9HYPH|nr:hypothetical protein MES4922_190280 [Mesorhizobium ventifaucium]